MAIHTPFRTQLSCVQTLQDIKRDYESESLEWQTKWRFVIFVILFVLLIILAVIAGSLGASFGAPRVTAAFVTLLWIFLIITMVVGAGMLHLFIPAFAPVLLPFVLHLWWAHHS